METKHLSYFKVENFKRFHSLEVNDIGQFNLIVGDNNVGKTTLMEALLFDENSNQFLLNLCQCLIAKKTMHENRHNVNYLDFFLKDKNKSIDYQFKYNTSRVSLSVTKRKIEEIDPAEIINLQGVLAIQNNNISINPSLIEFNYNGKKNYELTLFPKYDSKSAYLPFVSFDRIYDKDLVQYFSELSISNNKLENIKREFTFFIPNLTSIEINNALIPKQTVIAIREKDKDLIPLTQYGDGTIKLFRYLLEIEFCENKRLMIDEIDTGIHYSRMKEFLKKILQNAKNKNVQIFATTHSKECIQYYTQALQELGYENEGRIIRLADTKSGIKAYTLNFPEFENALLADSEIR